MTVINTGLGQQDSADADAAAFEQEQYEDYFGFDEVHRYMLPDGRQWIEFKALNEGDRVKYEAKTSKDIHVNRRTDDARIKINAGEDRHELILQSVTGWHMVRKNVGTGKFEPVAFSTGSPGATFTQWLAKANPRIINELFAEIQKANGWMTADMTPDMIREEMDRLKVLLDETVAREAQGKSSSSK